MTPQQIADCSKIEQQAPINFIAACQALGIRRPVALNILAQPTSADSRAVIRTLALVDLEPVYDAWDEYLAWSGRTTYRPVV